jgi:hypothetical protein
LNRTDEEQRSGGNPDKHSNPILTPPLSTVASNSPLPLPWFGKSVCNTRCDYWAISQTNWLKAFCIFGRNNAWIGVSSLSLLISFCSLETKPFTWIELVKLKQQQATTSEIGKEVPFSFFSSFLRGVQLDLGVKRDGERGVRGGRGKKVWFHLMGEHNCQSSIISSCKN